MHSHASGRSRPSHHSKPGLAPPILGALCAAFLAGVLALAIPSIAAAAAVQQDGAQDDAWSPLFRQGLAAFPEQSLDAAELFTKSLEQAKDNLQKAFSYHMVARSYEVRGFEGPLGGANVLYEKAQYLFDDVMPSAAVQDNPDQKAIVESFVVTNLQRLGVAYSQSAFREKAEATLERAGSIAHANPDIPKHLVVAADLALSGHYARNARWDEAEASLDQAAVYVEGLPEHDPWLTDRISDFRTWLVTLRSEHE